MGFKWKRTCTAGAIALAVLFGLLAMVFGLQAGGKSTVALGAGEKLHAHAVDYDSVTQADLPAAKTVCGVCGKEAYAIASQKQLAAFIKCTTADDRLAACYRVTYQPSGTYLDLSAWSSVCIGMNAEAIFSGHIDFNGETIQKSASVAGFFPTAQNAEIRNLNVTQAGGNANALGNTASGTTVTGLTVTADYTGTTVSQTGGVFNTVTDCFISNVTVTINSTGIIFSLFGGFAYQATDCTVSAYRVNLANKSYTYDKFGGLFCEATDVVVTNSTVYMPNDGGQTHYVRKYDGVGGMISVAKENFLMENCNAELGYTSYWANQGFNAGGFVFAYTGSSEKDKLGIIRNCIATGKSVVMRNNSWTAIFLARINAFEAYPYANVRIENCVSKVENCQAVGVFFGGMCVAYSETVRLDIVDCVNQTAGNLLGVFYGGDVNSHHYKAVVNVTNCVNYANVTNVFAGGANNNGMSTITIQGCKDYSTGSTNIAGSSVNGNLTVKDTEYTNGSMNISGSGDANTSNVTSGAKYLPPETYIPEKVSVNATVVNQGDAVTLTIDFKDLMDGYQIKCLSIGLLGEWSGAAYTELVHNFVTLTEVNGLSVGSRNIAASGVVMCTYAASAENRNIVVGVTLSNGTKERMFKLYAGSNQFT